MSEPARGDRPARLGGSRLGRRLVLLFTACALVPLVVFAWLAVASATRQMREDLRQSLHGAAKSAGMGLAARANQVAGDLALLRTYLDDDAAKELPPSLLQHLGGRSAGIWIEDDAGLHSLFGVAPEAVATPTAAQLRHLAAGKPLLRTAGAAGLEMALALPERRGRLVARLRGDWFWDPEELCVAGTDVAVFDGQWRPLYHTFAILPELGPLQVAAMQRHTVGSVVCQAGGEAHLACLWRAFLLPQYGFDFLVVQSRAEHAALAISRGFAWWLASAGFSTLCLVLLASLVQIRRILGPIVSLRDGTRRLALGDLAARVEIRSADEFGDLGGAFNHMAAQLQENVRRREQTERELIASRDAALAAVHAKAEFVTNVSHELRTPMTEILGAVEILSQMEGLDDSARLEFSGIALRGAQRLAQLVDDVLELDAGRPPEAVVLQPADTLRAALAALPPEQAARVRPVFAEELPDCRGDAVRLQQLWLRLLDNACKFSAPDQPVELRARGEAGALVVEVADRGVGIAAADCQRIFEPFCQVGRDQLTDKAGGTGLGLTLARREAERHGGRIEVDSQPGRGSVFRVVIPAVAAVPVS